MSKTNLVRASRDGDQFHYLWAARRCLLLISPTVSLKAITIEGPSLSETDAEEHVTAGEELIDVGEYYGSESLEEATLIRYIQVKHSTVRTDKAWTPSELEKTFGGFAERYKALQQHLRTVDLGECCKTPLQYSRTLKKSGKIKNRKQEKPSIIANYRDI
ncbi:MAG: hypothetical protein ACOY31_11315 [Bacillota bacterium]